MDQMTNEQKLERMVSISGADLGQLTQATRVYGAARRAGKSARRAHTLTMKAFGERPGSWDYATWAQNLVDAQMVSL